MPQLLRTIAIVGGGFSGTLVAANLLKSPPQGPTRIVLLESRSEIGPGVAYSARGPQFLLNVPASRMSAVSSDPQQFLDYARRRNPQAGGEDFLPRQLYGEYLKEVLLAAQLSAPRNVQLDRVHTRVVGLYRISRTAPLQVELDDGQLIVADDVVLACGNPSPANVAGSEGVAAHPRYVRDAYATAAGSALQGTVLLIGTGLTMADTLMSASSSDRVVFHALSRHGLIPPVQTPFRPHAFKGNGNALLLSTASSLRSLVSVTRLLAREAEGSGGDWREAVTFARNMAPALWQRLPLEDKRRFLRHLRTYWDVHRHRLPAQTIHRIGELRRAGRLHVHAGRITRLEPAGPRITAHWRPRGAAVEESIEVDWVVNCTGPDYDLHRSQDPLFQRLLQTGVAVRDPLGLGLRTGAHGAVIDADGWPAPHLFYVGPMLRADLWEATAAAELRVHAERLAVHLASRRT